MHSHATHSNSTAPNPGGSVDPYGRRSSPAAGDHSVQFYEDEGFLSRAVGDFLADGLVAGDSAIVIASERRSAMFRQHLASTGFDVDQARASGQLALLDAREMLSRIMDEEMPHPERFRANIGRAIETTVSGRRSGTLRMYGEMVDLLWKDGNTEGAIRLEELWNELGRSHSFSLLCAYAMGNFYKSADVERFQRVCQQHTRVLPTERYSGASEADRLLEIAQLQQRARTLEAEIEHRRELEQRLRDTLSARQRAEEALRERERELRAALADREELLERERAARADAERADRAKSQFLAMMSHELRTPLNAIGGHVQLVEMGLHGPVSDAQREALGRVGRSQRHLLALINDLLNLARIESGRIEYELAPLPIDALLSEIVCTLEPLLASKQLSCDLPTRPSEPPVAFADRQKVHQILVNVLTNAIKFTPADGRIVVTSAMASDGAVEVRVRDTGIGIAAGHLESVFEPFVQLPADRSSDREGVGLGLAISRDLARGMGGDLRAESTLGEGATFVLTLPTASAPASR